MKLLLEGKGAVWALLLGGLLLILLVAGRALSSDRTLLPLDLIYEAYLPWANDVSYPKFADHYSVDAVHEYLPMYSFYGRELAKGRIPTWNPYNRGGSSFIENPVRLPFHPARLLLRWIPVDQVIDITAILHLTLAFVTMVIYLRARGLCLPAVFLGGLSFSFSSYFVLNILHERNVAALTLLPIVLLYFERTAREGRWRDVAGLSGFMGITLLVAGPAAIFLILMALGARLTGVVVWETSRPAKVAFGKCILAGIVACLLAAPSLFSTLHGLFNNVRLFDYAGTYSLSGTVWRALGGYLGLLVAAVDPYLVGSRDSLDVLKLFNQTIRLVPYAGSFALIFVCFSLPRIFGDAANRWLLVLLALALVLLYPTLVSALSQRSVFLVVLFIVIASAIGFDSFWNADSEALHAPARWLAAATVSAWAVFLTMEVALRYFGGAITGAIQASVQKQIPGYMFERYAEWKLDAATRFVDLHRLSSVQSMLFLGGLTLVYLAVYRYVRSGNPAYKSLVLIIVAAAPVLFAAGNLFIIDERVYPIPEKPAYFDTLDTGVEQRRVWFANENKHDRLLMPRNIPDLFGIRQVQGYGSLIPINPTILLRGLALTHPLFKTAGVNFLVTARDSGFRSEAFPLHRYSGEVNIYSRQEPVSRFHVVGRLARVDSREEALKRARDDTRASGERYHYLTELPTGYAENDDIRAEIHVTSDDIRRIALTAEVNAPSLLLLADTWYPGWTARVNGKREKILAVDGAFRGVWLDAGKSDIVFEYVHWPSRIGFGGSAIGIVALLLLFVVALRERKTSQAEPG